MEPLMETQGSESTFDFLAIPNEHEHIYIAAFTFSV